MTEGDLSSLSLEKDDDMARCDDCLDELGNGRRFAVLKQTREWPPDIDPAEAKLLNGMLYDLVMVCDDCAGWYGDDAVELTGEVFL